MAQCGWLPSYEELTVPELNLTSAVLRAGARHLGKYCDEECKEFMLCRKEMEDPRRCLGEGKEVTRCGIEFFTKLRQHCMEPFTTYWKCLDKSGVDFEYKECRKQQAVYDQCVLENFNQENPPVGYFSLVRIHDSKRPKPVRVVPPMPKAPPDLPDPDTLPDPPTKHFGGRGFFPPSS